MLLAVICNMLSIFLTLKGSVLLSWIVVGYGKLHELHDDILDCPLIIEKSEHVMP